jgi:hypothetical protein
MLDEGFDPRAFMDSSRSSSPNPWRAHNRGAARQIACTLKSQPLTLWELDVRDLFTSYSEILGSSYLLSCDFYGSKKSAS